MIRRICEGVPLPVNAMIMPGLPDNARLAALGVARISYGAQSYRDALTHLREEAGKVYG